MACAKSLLRKEIAQAGRLGRLKIWRRDPQPCCFDSSSRGAKRASRVNLEPANGGAPISPNYPLNNLAGSKSGKSKTKRATLSEMEMRRALHRADLASRAARKDERRLTPVEKQNAAS